MADDKRAMLFRLAAPLGKASCLILRVFCVLHGLNCRLQAEHAGKLTPIEVKWTENPTLNDARNMLAFLNEKPKQAQQGYIICRCRRPLQLHDKITALPWFCL